MTEFGTEPTFRAYPQVLRHRKWWVGRHEVTRQASREYGYSYTHKPYQYDYEPNHAWTTQAVHPNGNGMVPDRSQR
jgi:hypothetical protein